MSKKPQPPKPPAIPPTDPQAELVENVKQALLALPIHFRSETHIEGVDVGDLFGLNTLLGGTIEAQVVETLNALRSVWDPDSEYLDYSFKRHSQSFPDVRLTRQGETTPILGIELKGWYLLAREGEPSFRYKVTPSASSERDLLVIVPWHLEHVLSGGPVVLAPFIESARYVAEYRNYWWQHERRAKSDARIVSPKGVKPYPPPRHEITDTPTSDGGGNFGRVARMRLESIDQYVETTLQSQISGVEAGAWLRFMNMHREGYDPVEVRNRLDNVLEASTVRIAEEKGERLKELLEELAGLIALSTDLDVSGTQETD